jgi:hypothetical protein
LSTNRLKPSPLRRVKPAVFISDHFRKTLPPEAPLPFTIKFYGDARYKKCSGNCTIAVADVVMFDSLRAQIELMVLFGAISYRWLALPGGDCSFEDGKWVRVPPALAYEVPQRTTVKHP